jgi:hypothetical protein
MVRELLYILYLLVSIPCLIFVISILLFPFVFASAGSYISLPLVATVYIFQYLPQYCMKSTVDTQLLNMLHSHQQHTTAVYISACVIWHEHQYTFHTASYSWSHSHTAVTDWYQPNKQSSYGLSVVSEPGIAGKYLQWQPIYSRKFIRSNLLTDMLTNYLSKWINCWLL